MVLVSVVHFNSTRHDFISAALPLCLSPAAAAAGCGIAASSPSCCLSPPGWAGGAPWPPRRCSRWRDWSQHYTTHLPLVPTLPGETVRSAALTDGAEASGRVVEGDMRLPANPTSGNTPYRRLVTSSSARPSRSMSRSAAAVRMQHDLAAPSATGSALLIPAPILCQRLGVRHSNVHLALQRTLGEVGRALGVAPGGRQLHDVVNSHEVLGHFCPGHLDILLRELLH